MKLVLWSLIVGLALLPTMLGASSSRLAVAQEGGYEVWLLDQSDSIVNGGGKLYIYQGSDLAGPAAGSAVPEVVDLGGAAHTSCINETGSAPRRPHMIFFNESQTHAIISYVATGHVLFMDAATRSPIACVDAGTQAHAAIPSPDEKYIVVANQNGKLLQRINTQYASSSFVLDNVAEINLATCTTPSGANCEDGGLRLDNAPICPAIDSTSRFSFVTLRGGGMLVVDGTATPMAIVAEYDYGTIHPNGCGGLETNGKMYINAGGGTPANPTESDLYAFEMSAFSTTPGPVNTPAPRLVFSHDDRGFVDSHGMVLIKQQPFLWVADRAANSIVVVDTRSDEVVNEISLAGDVSGDPAPDLMDISPDGSLVFIALRGPNPLTANVADVNNAVGNTPGLGIMRVEQSGRGGVLRGVLSISNLVGGSETADPHGIRLRRM